ncbi:MAG: class I SAM-dependent methyltransferase [Desulfobacteraceae bacterium]|nr:class I SAM-dependent methyltransferase [Desulfobacteraceae bacterium]
MSIIGSILKYFLYPQHLYQVIKLQRNRKKIECVYDDAQLKLYSQLLPKDFLHYGYFEDPSISPWDISINHLYKAQEDYGRLIVNQITDYNSPVLDIGCGMGGLSALMHGKNLNVVALTPDKHQVRHLTQKYKGLQVMDCRFEDMPAGDFTAYFGTAVTSESLQYLKLDEALPLIDKILKPGGKWVACDYFKKGETGEKSGHSWRLFNTGLRQNGFKMTYQRDITPNVLPTIAFAYMWASQIGMPIKEFVLGKLKVKAPGIYYAMEEVLPEIEKKINKNMDTINPATFAANKHYVLMVIERTG